jgi:DNA polymerase-3 subunit alpha
MDFPDDRRGELIEYTVNKYGSQNVAQIIAYGTMGARAASARRGPRARHPLGEVDSVAKLIRHPGKPVSIAKRLTRCRAERKIQQR